MKRMGVESLFAESEIDKYKKIEVICNTEKEWNKGHDMYNSLSEQAKKEGYKGVSILYTGLYVKTMLDKINKDMIKVRRAYKIKNAASERRVAEIVINT